MSKFPFEPLPSEIIQIIRDLNPWWEIGRLRKPAPRYLRRGVSELLARVVRPRGLVEVIRGPRQVGKTTAIEQVIEHLLRAGANPKNILFVRFDQEVLRSVRGGLLNVIRWFESSLRKKPFQSGGPVYVFLDEIHKLDRWDEDVKHLGDTYPVRLALTGSSSVLVSRGGRESLAGRILMTDLPTFQFREILEAWTSIATKLPKAHNFADLFTANDPRDLFNNVNTLRLQQKHSLRRQLERYYNRGGYPRLYNGEVEADLWADYLTETIFNRVLGVDVPDLFPVQNPKLLRWLYVEIARATGQEIIQNRLAEDANSAGFATSQPLLGKYMHYLSDALLIREFLRYPMAKRSNVRSVAKFTLTDLGARNAVFRGAPSLWESSPEHVGPLIETLSQSVLRGPNIQVHFFRDYEKPGNRMTKIVEVDFVAENIAGEVIPLEIKFRRTIGQGDFNGLIAFKKRFNAKFGIMVTRDLYEWKPEIGVLCVPLMEFLVAF